MELPPNAKYSYKVRENFQRETPHPTLIVRAVRLRLHPPAPVSSPHASLSLSEGEGGPRRSIQFVVDGNWQDGENIDLQVLRCNLNGISPVLSPNVG